MTIEWREQGKYKDRPFTGPLDFRTGRWVDNKETYCIVYKVREEVWKSNRGPRRQLCILYRGAYNHKTITRMKKDIEMLARLRYAS